MAVNNIYYVDMEKRYLDYQNGAIDMRNLHPMVYDDRNVALAVRQLGQSPGRMTPGPDGSNYKTLEKYSVMELAEIVKERLLKKQMDYVFKQNTKNVKKKGKLMVANCLPQEKADEIVGKCRELLRAIRKEPSFETFNNWNIYVVGIHNYYRGMTHFCESFSKIGWRIKKLFYHTMEKRATFTKEQSYKNQLLGGKYRSWGKDGYYCFGGIPIIRIDWANWDSGLISATKGVVRRKNPYDYGEKKHKPGVTMEMITYLVNTSKYIKNSRLAMFRISKYSSVKGISYLSGEFVPVENYHCHHIKPKSKGGTNDFDNLCVLSELEHQILHSSNPEQLYALFPKKKKRIKTLIGAL